MALRSADRGACGADNTVFGFLVNHPGSDFLAARSSSNAVVLSLLESLTTMMLWIQPEP